MGRETLIAPSVMMQNKREYTAADKVDFLRVRTVLVARARQMQHPNSISEQQIEELLHQQQTVSTTKLPAKPSFAKNVVVLTASYAFVWMVLLVVGTISTSVLREDREFLVGALTGMLLFAPVLILTAGIRYAALMIAHKRPKNKQC